MQISIKTNFPQIERRLAQLQHDVALKAGVRAVNGTLAQAKTRMSRAIRAEFNIKAAKVNASLRIERASYRGGVYRIEGKLESPSKRGRSINVINFEARKTAQGVSVKILRKRINELVIRMINEKFPEIFEREARYFTEKFNRS